MYNKLYHQHKCCTYASADWLKLEYHTTNE